ncbi:MAG: hypothetical protein KBG83_06775 [Bacteroidetes bacterium]|nr:hypothetical protein [Bacteroidota bacterium]
MPWSLVYSKEFPTRSEAMEYERAIKNRKSRKYIQSLVQSVPSLKIKSHQRSSAQSARINIP